MGRATWVVAVLAGCSFAPQDSRDGAVGHDVLVGQDVIVGRDGGMDAGSGSGSGSQPCLARWHDGSMAWGSPVELTELETAAVQVFGDPFVGSDELTIYFGGLGSDQANEDIFMATRAALGDPFGAPQLFAPASLPASAESKFSLSDDQLQFVVASDRSGGKGGADIWLSKRSGSSASFPAPAEAKLMSVDDSKNQYDPALAPNGEAIYFAPDTLGNQRIFVTTRANDAASFGSATEVPNVSTGAGDADPSTSADGTILVFSTGRVAGHSNDIFYALRDGSGDFGSGNPIPGPAIDTTDFEADPIIGRTGCRLYFKSDRSGHDAIWVSTMTNGSEP